MQRFQCNNARRTIVLLWPKVCCQFEGPDKNTLVSVNACEINFQCVEIPNYVIGVHYYLLEAEGLFTLKCETSCPPLAS